MDGAEGDTVERVVARLVREYAATPIDDGAIAPGTSLRDDLAIDSLALASLALRVGDAFEIDWSEEDTDLSAIATVGDLVEIGRRFARRGGVRPA